MVCGVVVSYAVVCVGVCVLKCMCVLFVIYCVTLPGVACLLLLSFCFFYVCWCVNCIKRCCLVC